MRGVIVIAFVSVFSCVGIAQVHGKLHVAVYYESLCPDSVSFIQYQLKPAYQDLKDYVDIQFIPFGKSSSYTYNNERNFICQHGPRECKGNKIQSCALNELSNHQDLQVEYVGCQMDSYADQSGKECAEQVGIDFDRVMQCYDSDLGTRLQLDAEGLTKTISPSFVPTIVYDHYFDQRLQNRSLRDFFGVVCELINNAAYACNQ